MKNHWKLQLIIILAFTFLKTNANIRDSTLRFPKGVYFKWTPLNLVLNKVPTFQVGLEFKFHNFYSIQTEIGIGTGSIWKEEETPKGYGWNIGTVEHNRDQIHNKYRIEVRRYIGKGSKSYLAFEACYFTTQFKRDNSYFIVDNIRYNYIEASANRRAWILWTKLGRQIGIGKYFFVDVFAGIGVRVSNAEYSIIDQYANNSSESTTTSSFWNVLNQDKYTGHNYIFPHAGFGAKLGFRIF